MSRPHDIHCACVALMTEAAARLRAERASEVLRLTAERDAARLDREVLYAGMEAAAGSFVSRDLAQQVLDALTAISDAPAAWQRVQRAEALLRKALNR